MELTYAFHSVAGLRPNNEDSTSFWQPESPEGWRTRGAIAILADGVGGHGHGEVASRMACDKAVDAFRNAKPGETPAQLLVRMFNDANGAIFEQSLDKGRMATTLTIAIFRNNEVVVGHVGDCRAYLLQQGRIRRITNDHSYAGVQLKLGLITVQEAASSELRSVLTRSVGQEPIVRCDSHTLVVNRGDVYVQVCDGVWSVLTEAEILTTASKLEPKAACEELIRLAERRGADDNLTAQVIRVESVERLSYYRGLPIYRKVSSDPMGNDVQVGDMLDGRYHIDEQISKSGMASIFKATDSKTGRVVAIKMPFMQYESDPGFFSRFKREEEIGTKLRHPYILRFESEDLPSKSRQYIVMEFLEGQTLGHLMRSVRPMPEEDALRITSLVCEALHYMHDHEVVHRDLKPENIMICNDGSIRIMDFGIAKYEASRRLTFGGFTPAMGTPDYMAPEQVKGKRGDPRTDIYSLGAILYEMVTGAVPFEGPNPFVIMNSRISGDPVAPRSINPKISPQVEEIILHAMARDPAQRYQSALDMKNDLDHPEAVQVTGRAHRLVTPVAWKNTWRRMRMLVIGICIPLAIFGVVYLIRKMHS
jgi:serine/threonine protein phosphatase PrpC